MRRKRKQVFIAHAGGTRVPGNRHVADGQQLCARDVNDGGAPGRGDLAGQPLI